MQGYAQYHHHHRSGRGGGESASQPPRFMTVSSCLKHFFAYDGPEDTGNTTRFNFDAQVTAQDLADSYLPAFEAGARPDLGAASGVMCSYNAVRKRSTVFHSFKYPPQAVTNDVVVVVDCAVVPCR